MTPVELDHRKLANCAFALIDPMRGDAADLAMWDSFDRQNLVPAGFEAQSGQFPRVLDLRAAGHEARQPLIDLLLDVVDSRAEALCVALLQAGPRAGQVVSHLRSTLAPQFPNRQRGIFRYYDPVVFEHLSWMLKPSMLAALMGPVDTWLLPLRGAWYSQQSERATVSRRRQFHVKSETWQRIARIGALHDVLSNEPQWQQAPSEWGARAEALLIRAEQHRLVEREDAVAFARLGLRWHADFERHPRVKALLASSAGHPMRFQRLSGRWSDTDWQTIADDLNKADESTKTAYIEAAPSQGVY